MLRKMSAAFTVGICLAALSMSLSTLAVVPLQPPMEPFPVEDPYFCMLACDQGKERCDEYCETNPWSECFSVCYNVYSDCLWCCQGFGTMDLCEEIVPDY